MKKIFLISIIIFICSLSASAQIGTTDTVAGKLNNQHNIGIRQKAREMIEQKKREHFESTMNLTKEESDVFWPVYRQFDSKRRALGMERSKVIREFELNKSKITDSEAKQMNAQLLDLQKKEYDLVVQYTQIFEATISPKKAFLLNKAESDFQRGLLKSMGNTGKTKRDVKQRGSRTIEKL